MGPMGGSPFGAGRTTPQAAVGAPPPLPPNFNINTFLGGVGPLDRNRFDAAYQNFCAKRNFQFNPASLQIENRQVDLYALHRSVFSEGGYQKVRSFSSDGAIHN